MTFDLADNSYYSLYITSRWRESFWPIKPVKTSMHINQWNIIPFCYLWDMSVLNTVGNAQDNFRDLLPSISLPTKKLDIKIMEIMKIWASSDAVSHKCLSSFYCTAFQDLKNFLGPSAPAIFWRRGLCSTKRLLKNRSEISYMMVDKDTLEALWKMNLGPRWARCISEQHWTALLAALTRSAS